LAQEAAPRRRQNKKIAVSTLSPMTPDSFPPEIIDTNTETAICFDNPPMDQSV
jgi:hypothetical protein